ncbi:uncharacterized protein LOC114747457 [Neltuma alba]|uniref:uncharacterized protein LOC114747457 n=1 Tax=Neltuma alba TaxID=207710 RepID=UPI0010A41932|nr:uncharacterized protein LOC114747457 [Prosopis alba]
MDGDIHMEEQDPDGEDAAGRKEKGNKNLDREGEQNETRKQREEKGTFKSPISYKEKLMGGETQHCEDKDLDGLMIQWLREEEELAPLLIEAEKELLGSLPRLNISDERLKELCRPWKNALILTVLGKTTSLQVMKDRVGWLPRTNKFKLIDLPNNYFVFRTDNLELNRRLLFDGPWLIQGHYLVVQRWSPNFNPYCNRVHKVAIWVRVPTLLMHMYSEECMWERGNLIRKSLKVDMNTLA